MSSPGFVFKATDSESARRPLLDINQSWSLEDNPDPSTISYTSSDTMYTANSNLNSYSTTSNTNGTETNWQDTRIHLSDDIQPQSDRDEEQRAIVVNSTHSRRVGVAPRIENIESRSRITAKLASALFYGISSFLITVINKIVLTSYAFPSSNLLGVGQMITIILILGIASQFKYVKIRKVSLGNYQVWVLAAIYLGNLVAGLGGTKHLTLPMFIALRRFSIALTAILEFFLLNVIVSTPIILTIIAMIGGSVIAASSDLSFNGLGYLFVMTNNLFTAANVVYIKKTVDSKIINNYELLYYNAVITIIPLFVLSYFTNDKETLYNYPHWTEFGFIISFLLSCMMGFLLMFSTVLCTHYNSALTTTIVGTLKNILTTYIGMFIGGDYVFGALNFVGLNISLLGSLVYSYIVFMKKT